MSVSLGTQPKTKDALVPRPKKTSKACFCHPSTNISESSCQASVNSCQAPLPKCKSVVSTNESSPLNFNNVHQYSPGKYLQGQAIAHNRSHNLLSCLCQGTSSLYYHWPVRDSEGITAAGHRDQCSSPRIQECPSRVDVAVRQDVLAKMALCEPEACILFQAVSGCHLHGGVCNTCSKSSCLRDSAATT